MYNKYRATHSGQRPKDLEALTAFTSERGGYTLKRLGISEPTQLFQSERDGQPYVLFLADSPPQFDGQAVLGHEAEGIGGKRVVGLESGEVRLVDAQDVDNLKVQK